MPKRIEFLVSSLVDLKSELFKKQQESVKKKAANIDLIGPENFVSSKKALFEGDKSKSSGNRGATIKNITKPKSDPEEEEEEERRLQLSRDRLIQKSTMYDQLSSGSMLSGQLDTDAKALYLVDFERKAHENENYSDVESELDESAASGEFLAENSEEEWTDYVDSFGRTRRCMKKDLPKFNAPDDKFSHSNLRVFNAGDSEPSTSNEYCAGEAKVIQRLETKSGPVHYQNLLQDEIRDHGAAYYQFSSDEAERQKQLRRLEELSKQTAEKRRTNEELKAKRRHQMQARLAKVKERKKLTVDIDLDEETSDSVTATQVNLADILLPGEEAEQEKIDKMKNEQLEHQRAQHVRPWDKGKRKIYTQDEWLEKERRKRYSEFCPPSTYFSSS